MFVHRQAPFGSAKRLIVVCEILRYDLTGYEFGGTIASILPDCAPLVSLCSRHHEGAFCVPAAALLRRIKKS